jgi:hypothetical protein
VLCAPSRIIERSGDGDGDGYSPDVAAD